MRPDYQATEFGPVPATWQVTQLASLATVSAGGTPKRDVHRFWGGDIPWVTTKEVDFNTIKDTAEHITLDGLRNSAAKVLPPGTLLLALYGQGKTRGKVAVLGIAAATNQACAAISLAKSICCRFVFYSLASRYDEIRSRSNSGNQDNLNSAIVRALPMLLPPRDEQRAIATALGDVDALLGALDKLIAKKRDLKQAAMQQLLTGRTRLPGFTDEWPIRRLGDALKICHGRSQQGVAVEDGKFPILATGGQIGTASKPLYDQPSVLIGRKGTIDRPQYMETPFWTVDTLFYSIMKSGNDAKFFYYRFCLIDWMQFNEASGVPSLSAKTVEAIEIGYPSTQEQAAIVTVFSDMDAEIAALEARRAKTADLKQAMMQELLTGRIRLVEAKEAAATPC